MLLPQPAPHLPISAALNDANSRVLSVGRVPGSLPGGCCSVSDVLCLRSSARLCRCRSRPRSTHRFHHPPHRSRPCSSHCWWRSTCLRRHRPRHHRLRRKSWPYRTSLRNWLPPPLDLRHRLVVCGGRDSDSLGCALLLVCGAAVAVHFVGNRSP